MFPVRPDDAKALCTVFWDANGTTERLGDRVLPYPLYKKLNELCCLNPACTWMVSTPSASRCLDIDQQRHLEFNCGVTHSIPSRVLTDLHLCEISHLHLVPPFLGHPSVILPNQKAQLKGYPLDQKVTNTRSPNLGRRCTHRLTVPDEDDYPGSTAHHPSYMWKLCRYSH